MKNSRVFPSQNFQFLEVKFSLYLNRRVFVMVRNSERIMKVHLTSPERPTNIGLQLGKATYTNTFLNC